MQARDADSLSELQRLSKEANWLWIDCMEPDDKELEIIAGLLKGTDIISAIRKHQTVSRWEKINDYVLISIPLVVFKDTLETYPIYVFAKEKILITVRSKHSSKSINNTLKTFQDCILKVCERGVASSFIVSRLLHEVSDENLDVVMALRARTDEIEEKALANPGDKQINKTVFALKRKISTLERILWTQRELILSIEEGVVPVIQSSELSKQTLRHAVSNVLRELSLISSNDNALDSILRLQDLGMIHRVERTLVYLTLLTLIVSIIMILIEVGVLRILSG
ncbi:MAG: CorA family divalent cation transporter [Candidatus Bathyarchaeales archaeon]